MLLMLVVNLQSQMLDNFQKQTCNRPTKAELWHMAAVLCQPGGVSWMLQNLWQGTTGGKLWASEDI